MTPRTNDELFKIFKKQQREYQKLVVAFNTLHAKQAKLKNQADKDQLQPQLDELYRQLKLKEVERNAARDALHKEDLEQRPESPHPPSSPSFEQKRGTDKNERPTSPLFSRRKKSDADEKPTLPTLNKGSKLI